MESTMKTRSILVLFLVISGLMTASSSAAERPNIVLIMADDLGFSDIGCFGSEIETPNLDALAAAGLRGTQFYNTAKCHSSRVSLLTGLYCDQAGSAKLSRGATIAEVLGKAGYFTAMSGKWHLSKQPTDFGFQRYWGHLSGATNFFTGDDSFRLNGEKYTVPKTLNGRPFYTTHAITDFALQFLDEANAKDDPFLLYIAFNAPHYPLHAPEDAVRKYDGVYDRGWDVLRHERHKRQLASGLLPAKWKLSPRPAHIPAWDSLSKSEQQWEADRMEVFAAMVDLLDQNVGRLVKSLQEKDEFENTLFLFCSDNGACPFERTRGKDLKPWDPKSYWTYDASWAHVGNTPFRLYKQNQHEGGISSPLIAHWPAGIKDTGRLVKSVNHLVDIMPTVLEVTDSKAPETLNGKPTIGRDGESLAAAFKGHPYEGHETLFFHHNKGKALRHDGWKLVSRSDGGKKSKGNQQWELYNLDNDPLELNNLAQTNPKQLAKLTMLWMAESKRLEGQAAQRRRPAAQHPF